MRGDRVLGERRKGIGKRREHAKREE